MESIQAPGSPSVAEPTDQLEGLDLVEAAGPWPFITLRSYRGPGGASAIWHSRTHRKRLHATGGGHPAGISARLQRALWLPCELNWWIGVIFALGSSLFILGSVLSLAPVLARHWSLDATTVNAVFFAGSIPFTTAAYLQLFQAANAPPLAAQGPRRGSRVAIIGWLPKDIGWLSAALQLTGTVLFNINTLDAMRPGLTWLQQDLAIWAPDLVGSCLFLASGYLAFAETCHAHFAWRPDELSWWVTLINLVGCVAFMVSALYAFVPAVPAASSSLDAGRLAVVFTLIGAAGFLLGSLLMLPETAEDEAVAA